MGFRKSTIVALMYLGYVFILTLHPFEFSRPELQPFSISSFFAGVGPRDFILNILLFIPLGVLVHRRQAIDRRQFSPILIAVIVGAVVSILIELLQIFSVRRPSAADVVANTLGTIAGAILSALWPRRFADLTGLAWERVERSRMLLCAAVLYGAVPLILSVVQFLGPFRTWNSLFSFQVGNEATFNRPWLGKIHFVALYNRALSGDEITQRFHQGCASGLSKNPNEAGLISLYRFNEGEGDVVHDLSGFEAPLDLQITPVDGIRWLDPNGIEILQPTILRSQGAVTKLTRALRATDELSIEVWLTPDNTMQKGPARIVSFSRNIGRRNFVLGQEGAEIEFRMRTPASGMNGTPLKSGREIAAGKQAQVVATYENGVEKLYIDGRQQAEKLHLPSDWIIGFGTGRTPITRIAYSFFYAFPVSLFLALSFRKHVDRVPGGLLLPVVVASGLVLASESFQTLAFSRFIDIGLLVAGTIMALLGTVSGQILSAARPD
jgi:glycopeptide antibiotics resistance protein